MLIGDELAGLGEELQSTGRSGSVEVTAGGGVNHRQPGYRCQGSTLRQKE